jgi:ubiquinone/menaquinone biosynthesis C-methylase UbiE
MSQNETQISRVTRSKEEAKASYNMMSKWYDMLAGLAERKCRDTGLQKLSAKEGEIVLEIGFGTGHGILALAQSVGNSGKVYGVDISEGMCNITQSRVREAGLSKRVELKCGDAAKLPFEANFFDAVFTSFTLELFDTPEIPIVLHECQRVLRSGRRICVVAMSKKGKANVIMRLYEWAHRKLPRYVDCRPIFVQEALEDAGFQILDITEMSMVTLPVEIAVAKKV